MRVRLELFVEDMQESIGFYARVLGFEVEREEPGVYASLRNGTVVLGIGPISKLDDEGGYFTEEIASLRRGLGVEIVLEVDDVDGWYHGSQILVIPCPSRCERGPGVRRISG